MLGLIFRFLARYARPYLPYYLLGGVMLVATNWAMVRIPVRVENRRAEEVRWVPI